MRTTRRFPTYLLVTALCGSAAGTILLPAPAARAAEEDLQRIPSDRLPEAAAAVLRSESRDSHDVQYYRVNRDEYAAHYTKPYHLRIELKVSADGRILSRAETRNQPELEGRRSLEAARGEFVREEELRQAGLRELAERREREARRAEHEVRREEWRERDGFYRDREAQLAYLEAEARRQRAADEDARQMTREWHEDRVFTVRPERLPEGARRTLDALAAGGRDVVWFRYAWGDQTFYSVHYTVGEGRRFEARVDESGNLLGKAVLSDEVERRYRERQRWLDEQWDAQPVRVSPEDAPLAVRDAIRHEARGGSDVEYYRQRVPEHRDPQYIVGYTDPEGRRIHLTLSDEGRVLERREFRVVHERR